MWFNSETCLKWICNEHLWLIWWVIHAAPAPATLEEPKFISNSAKETDNRNGSFNRRWFWLKGTLWTAAAHKGVLDLTRTTARTSTAILQQRFRSSGPVLWREYKSGQFQRLDSTRQFHFYTINSYFQLNCSNSVHRSHWNSLCINKFAQNDESTVPDIIIPWCGLI